MRWKVAHQAPKHEYAEPTSVPEARERRDRLNQEISDIELQLASGSREVEGRWLSARELQAWRLRVKLVINGKRREALKLRSWIREHSSSGVAMRHRRVRSGASPMDLARDMRDMTGLFYSLYLKAGEYMADPTDVTEAGLEESYEVVRTFLGDASEE